MNQQQQYKKYFGTDVIGSGYWNEDNIPESQLELNKQTGPHYGFTLNEIIHKAKSDGYNMVVECKAKNQKNGEFSYYMKKGSYDNLKKRALENQNEYTYRNKNVYLFR